MTATQPQVPPGAHAPIQRENPDTGRVPVATTIVVFALVSVLLAFIAWVD